MKDKSNMLEIENVNNTPTYQSFLAPAIFFLFHFVLGVQYPQALSILMIIGTSI